MERPTTPSASNAAKRWLIEKYAQGHRKSQEGLPMQIPVSLHARAIILAYLITVGVYVLLNLTLLTGVRHWRGGTHFVADQERESADEKLLRNPCQKRQTLAKELCAALEMEQTKKPYGLQREGLERILNEQVLTNAALANTAKGTFKERGSTGEWTALLRHRIDGCYWDKVWLPFGMLEIVKPERLVATIYSFVPDKGPDAAKPRDEAFDKRIDVQKNVQVVHNVLDWYVARLDEDPVAGGWKRLIRFFNGFIQWCTVFVASWCFVLLRYRRAWARIETSILAGERLQTLMPEYEGVSGIWADKKGSYAHVFTAIGRLGASILPFRLLRDLRRDYRAGRSDHAAEGIRAIADTYRQQVDTGEWTLLRWQLAVIPMLGFVGTVYGMIMAMGGVGGIIGVSDEEVGRQMDVLSRHLGTAFDTTLLALVLSIGLERFAGRVFAEESGVFDALAHRGVDQLASALPELMRPERGA